MVSHLYWFTNLYLIRIGLRITYELYCVTYVYVFVFLPSIYKEEMWRRVAYPTNPIRDLFWYQSQSRTRAAASNRDRDLVRPELLFFLHATSFFAR
jgi:hypothetical protein